MQALRSTRPGGSVGCVGVPHGVTLPGQELFYSHVGLRGGPAPVRRFLPELIDLVRNREIDLDKVFNLTLPLNPVAECYRAMDERRAIKALTEKRVYVKVRSPEVAVYAPGCWRTTAAPSPGSAARTIRCWPPRSLGRTTDRTCRRDDARAIGAQRVLLGVPRRASSTRRLRHVSPRR